MSIKWVNKEMLCIYTIELYLLIKKNEIMTLAGKWIELEIIILNEVIQTEKNKYHMFLCFLSYVDQRF